ETRLGNRLPAREIRKERKEKRLNLFTGANADFTTWVVKAGILGEPFVLVDVGVQGGESRSWHRLGDYLVVHGFDAIEEAIDHLRNRAGHVPNRHYHRIAAGNADEERVFHFNPANPTASSMYAQGTSRFDVPAGGETPARAGPAAGHLFFSH